jgi:cytochrome c oxidase subunit I+III
VSRALRLHKALDAIWATPPGWGRLAAVNHTTLGLRFVAVAFGFFAIGGLLAMLIRAQLATPASVFLGPEAYNQIFTMHGTVMMFLFAIPMFEGFAIYLLPKLLGARDMAFPRLTAYGFWCYVLGGSILIAALVAGAAPHAGWFMYTPLSSGTYSPGINGDVWLLGVTFVEISALSAAIEIIVSILKLRAPGMSLERMPILAWYLLVVAFMMLFGFPPLILGSILLELERAAGLPFFDPTRGGDPLLWQHLFWLFGHPEVYIIFLPAAGLVSTMLPAFARAELAAWPAIVVAVIATGFLSFGLWVHHMFTVGIPHLALAFFSAASGLVAVPTAVQIFAWIGTLAEGRPRWDVPMLWLAGFLAIFVLGGLTGVMLAMVPFNAQAHDSQFVVAHLHYVLVGGFVFPMMAAAHYWLPHVTGRVSDLRLSVPAFWLIFVGFNLTFLLMHLTGLLGMPRRVSVYPAEAGWTGLNLVSSVGGFLMAAGFALFVIDLVLQVRFGRRFRRDPWQARSLDWAMPTPPPAYAFASLPRVEDRADRIAPRTLGPALARGEGYLGLARHGWLETLGVDPATGEPTEVVVLPGPTFLPLWSGLATLALVLALLGKLYWLVPVPLAALVALLLAWTRTTGARADRGPLPIGRGAEAPPHWEVARPPSWWAMLLTLGADATLFASLLFGGLFLWLVAPGWPGPALPGPAPVPAVAALGGLGLAARGARRAVAALGAGRSPVRWLVAEAGGAALALAALLLLAMAVPAPTRHALPATATVILLYAALHAAVGVVLAGYGLARWRSGHLSPLRSLDLRLAVPWQGYSLGAGAVGIAAAAALPRLAAAAP